MVLACFINITAYDGVTFTFGLFIDILRESLEMGRAEVAAIGSMQVGICYLVGPLAGKLVDRLGCRLTCMAGAAIAVIGLFVASFCNSVVLIMFTYSVMGGFGFGLLFLPSTVAPSQHFSERRSLATGIAVCGSGAGMFLAAPVIEYVLRTQGWRAAFCAQSGIIFASLVCTTSLMIKPPVREDPNPKIESSTVEGDDTANMCIFRLLSIFVGTKLLKSHNLQAFIFIMLGDFLATMSLYIVYTYLPSMAKSHGVDEKNAAYLISVAGISSTLGRMFAGWLCDQGWVHPVTITFSVTLGAAVQAVLLTTSRMYWMFILFTSLFAFLSGIWVACETPLIISILKLDLLNSAFGLVLLNGGIAALTGPPMAGFIVDLTATNNQHVAFYMAGGIMLSSSTSYLVAKIIKKSACQ